MHYNKSTPLIFFLSLSFSVAINGAHQQSVTTIGTPPMPLVVTLTSCKFQKCGLGFVNLSTNWGRGVHPIVIIFVLLLPSNITSIMTSPPLLLPLEFEALVRRFLENNWREKGCLPSFSLSLWVLCDATLKGSYACVWKGGSKIL